MNFDLGKEKEFLRANIRELVEREVPREYARELDEKEEFPEKVWKALAEGGYLEIPIPEEYRRSERRCRGHDDCHRRAGPPQWSDWSGVLHVELLRGAYSGSRRERGDEA